MDHGFDRQIEDLGNSVQLEHVNLRVPDQRLATLFYVTALGLTRDPFLMTGTNNMWINVGRSQFHMPSGPAQVLRGATGIVLPDAEALLTRLEAARGALADTAFDFVERDDHVEATCPWGNRVRAHAPSSRFGTARLGIAYVAFDVPLGSAAGIARFYREIMNVPAEASDGRAEVMVGSGQSLVFVETGREQPAFDGHHIQLYLVDFSGPYRRLLQRDLVSREDDQHQYRFQDIVDLDSGRVLFTIEHELRSLRHPMFGRPLLNRNPLQSNRDYVPGADLFV